MADFIASISTKMLDKLGDERGKIEDGVNSLVAVLKKIELLFHKAHNNKKVQEHSEELRSLAYDIEDLLELYAMATDVGCMRIKNEKKSWIKKILRRQDDGLSIESMVSGFSFAINILLRSSTKIKWFDETFPDDGMNSLCSTEVEELEQRAVDRSTSRKSVRWQPTSAINGMVEHFVGMDEDVEKLIIQLLNVDKDPLYRVVSIWGAEGLGKTSLAKKIYNHPNVRTRFNAFAWVSLSKQSFQLASVLPKMLKQLGGGAVKRSITATTTAANAAAAAAAAATPTTTTVAAAAAAAATTTTTTTAVVAAAATTTAAASADLEHKKGLGLGPGPGPAEEKKTTAVEAMLDDKRNMIVQLQEIQRQKKCLIVIDDVFEISQWSEIRSACLLLSEDSNSNTRILLTAREEITDPPDLVHSHQLQLLDEDKGWELLKKYVFRGKEAAPDMGIAPKLGKEIVRKCGGLPSSISRLGRIMSAMSSIDKWHEVNDNVGGYLEKANQSQSSEISYEDSGSNNYFHLPYHLQQCFLYLGIFRKGNDAESSEDLALLWMAEGIISPSQKEGTKMEDIAEDDAEEESEDLATHEQAGIISPSQKQETIIEIAENYVHELASRDMLRVQVDDQLTPHRRFTQLFLEDHVRELSLSLGEKEDYRLKVVDFSAVKQPELYSHTLSDCTRRLVIHFNKPVNPRDEQLPELIANYEFRSLFFLNSDARECVDLPVKISTFEDFYLLRVLHFVRCKFVGRKLPEGIDKLLNLRYFGVLYCDLEELPESITNFKNLHVLNVRAHDDARIKIPNVLSEMKQLKHVNLVPNNNNSYIRNSSDKLKLDGLLDLETLVGFNADIHDLKSLYQLEKLRLLVAHAYSNESLKETIEFIKVKGGAQMQANLVIESKCSFSSSSPEGLAILEEVLMCSNLNSLTFSVVRMHKFPKCGTFASSSGLTKIKLTGCKLTEDPMEELGKFPNLQKLGLCYGAFVRELMAIATGFPKLEYLEFRCLPNLEKWRVSGGAMPRLSTMTVKRCPKLRGIPEELASDNYKTSLKNLDIDLAPGALSHDQKLKYEKMFDFIQSHRLTIREFDPLPSSSN